MAEAAAKKKSKKTMAHVRNANVQAAAMGLFSLDSREQAEKLLERFRRNFVISKEQDATDAASLRLWVKGYALTPEQEEQGYIGHFGVVRIVRKESGKWTLLMEPLPMPLVNHPQRKRPPQRHPDWGHPVLRNVRRGKPFEDVEAARRELLKLHEEFPEISIPGVDRLNIIIYHRKKSGGSPVEKVQLVIKPQEDKFLIVQADAPLMRPMPEPKREQGADAVKGKFTALVELKRKRRAAKPK